MDDQDEDVGNVCYASVSVPSPLLCRPEIPRRCRDTDFPLFFPAFPFNRQRCFYTTTIIHLPSMADGLQMTPEEWDDLKSKIDDSFWVMRVIGYPPLPEGAEGISCGAHKGGCLMTQQHWMIVRLGGIEG
jgi:hypothetical protein